MFLVCIKGQKKNLSGITVKLYSETFSESRYYSLFSIFALFRKVLEIN